LPGGLRVKDLKTNGEYFSKNGDPKWRAARAYRTDGQKPGAA